MYSLCCISNELKQDGHSFQTMTWKRYTQLREEYGDVHALKELGARWLNNVLVTEKTIEHCCKNGWGYRISSSLFPCLTHPDFHYDIEDIPQYKRVLEVFASITSSNTHPITDEQIVRLSCHPDQFNVLASDNLTAVNKTIKELNYHGWMMDMLGCSKTYYNPINIHVNRTNGNLEDIAKNFVNNLKRCNESVRSRLVVENEDKGVWNVANLIEYFYKPYKIPITFDNLHHKCNPSEIKNDYGIDMAMDICSLTWENIKPLFHYSESDPNNKNKRAHAAIPTDLPPSEQYDWEIELKDKDKAIRNLYLIELARDSQELKLY